MKRSGVINLVTVTFLAAGVHSFSPYQTTSLRNCCSDKLNWIAGYPAPDSHASLTVTSAALGTRHCLLPASSSTALPALLDPMVTSSLLQSTSESVLLPSADSIRTAFNVATFLPQPFWLFLILLPNSGVTKKMFGGLELVTLFCLVHFFIVVTSIFQPEGTAPIAEFNDVFDPSGNPQAAMVNMMQYPNFVSEEWSHVLTWDLFVGRWIWLDGLRRGVFTSHSVLLCNLIGPPGLLLHWATCIVTGKGLTPSEVPEEGSGDA